MLKGESGQSVTEFALILPILIIMLALIMDVGKAVHAKVNLQYL
ncbi:TadE/TadG family type IV pilus assembly protein, partial [Erysipelothrix rhusiopathiae]|nr:TadE/TadG family type IV pilus assembly protein [Erysipelothrix rhusiopathiae]